MPKALFENLHSFDYFYKRDLIANRPIDFVFHCVAVSGDSATGQLIDYVELCSTWRMVMCLSSQYTGEPIQRSYSLNPVTGEGIQLSFDLNFSREELRSAFNGEDDFFGRVGQSVQRHDGDWITGFLAAGAGARLSAGRSDGYGSVRCLASDSLSPEQLPEFTRIVTQEIIPCMIHQAPMLQSRAPASAWPASD